MERKPNATTTSRSECAFVLRADFCLNPPGIHLELTWNYLELTWNHLEYLEKTWNFTKNLRNLESPGTGSRYYP